ncbi:MAG TPA: Ig-like domain-containing protein [Saprospiraceae bacterium]|nr:Ig-like domain-containing protein [Saprospiraceae bacterium]HMQ82612.1 Ig-like domain-containing protein [Saprospiraceae bacterium]
MPILKLLAQALLLGVLAFACATPLPPEGGALDETPPRLVEEASTPNFQTNFQKQVIELTFDEWVQLQDQNDQVLTSPLVEYELSIKRKTVRFEFAEEEVLEENTTYTINFGEAVKDITERNPADNLRFVFSTGDYIDSLNVSGEMVDALSGEKVEDALFLLYTNLADTVVRKGRPFYFARTDTSGRFLIENVKEGVFKGFALKESNRNYRFDQASEYIGFPDSFLVVHDTLEPFVQLKIFTEEPAFNRVFDDDSRYGLLRVAFNKVPPPQLQFDYIDLNPDSSTLILEVQPDTTKIWYDTQQNAGWKLAMQLDTVFYDTVRVRSRDRAEYLEKAKLTLDKKAPKGVQRLHPTQPINLLFNHPITRIDSGLIALYKDTLKTFLPIQIALDTNGQRKLSLSHKWVEGQKYELEIQPGALTDIYGLSNDTLLFKYEVDLLKNYGNINFQVAGLSPDSAYVLELLDKSNKLIQVFAIQGQETFKYAFQTLIAGDYVVRIISDWNANGKWDTGNYDLKRQPEPIALYPLEPLRANWDLDSTIYLNGAKPESEGG